MTPNVSFRPLFPEAWERAYGRDESTRLEVGLGVFAMVLGAGCKAGAYGVVQDAYGTDVGNALMDYAMALLVGPADATCAIEDVLADEVTFSSTVRSERWYADLFATLTEEQHLAFRDAWLDRCRELGCSKVWLSIDGPICGRGQGTGSGRAGDSTIEAIDAADGRPVALFPVEGGPIDAGSLDAVRRWLDARGITVEGVICDEGSCTPEAVRVLRDLALDFVIALPRTTAGFERAFEAHAADIRWNTEYLIAPDGVFGIVCKTTIWEGLEEAAFVNLIFSGRDFEERSEGLTRQVWEALGEARSAIDQGVDPSGQGGLQSYLRVERDEGGRAVSVSIDPEAWAAALGPLGYFGVIMSRDMGPGAGYEALRLRGDPEGDALCLMAPDLVDASSAHASKGLRSRQYVRFLARVLRFELRAACASLERDLDDTLEEVRDIRLVRTGMDIYTPVPVSTEGQLALLGALGVKPDDLFGLARAFNDRLRNPEAGQEHRLPARKAAPRRGRGRQPGSKNKRTLEREAEIERQRAAGTYVEPTRRRPGRPAGSKDTKPRKRRSDAGTKRGPRQGRSTGDI